MGKIRDHSYKPPSSVPHNDTHDTEVHNGQSLTQLGFLHCSQQLRRETVALHLTGIVVFNFETEVNATVSHCGLHLRIKHGNPLGSPSTDDLYRQNPCWRCWASKETVLMSDNGRKQRKLRGEVFTHQNRTVSKSTLPCRHDLTPKERNCHTFSR